MNIINKSFLNDDLEKIESEYNAKYIVDLPLKTRLGYLNQPCAIFYADKAHPEGSNWFALFADRIGRLVITNAIELENKEFTALKVGDDIVYSSYRHDYRELGNSSIDGGLDYTKTTLGENAELITLKVTKNGLIEV